MTRFVLLCFTLEEFFIMHEENYYSEIWVSSFCACHLWGMWRCGWRAVGFCEEATHSIHSGTIRHQGRPAEIGGQSLLPITPIPSSPPPHTDNYINFQPPHTQGHGWLIQTSCALGERWKNAREGRINAGARERERKGEKWAEKYNFVIVWMIYGDPLQLWGNA